MKQQRRVLPIACAPANRSSTTAHSAATLGSTSGGSAGGGGGADVPDGLADHSAHHGNVEGRQAAVGEPGESAGDQLRDGVRTAGDSDQDALGQAVVERGSWVGLVSMPSH
ncbi:hypothetical protein [Streptomyces sp. NPDC058572]|uniref:hypothetical protein n=1 Tax=Streptomyces sp. NPDC058572 TaxID=3346546 RepID=UPI0036506EB0